MDRVKRTHCTIYERQSVIDTAACRKHRRQLKLSLRWAPMCHKFHIGAHGARETPVPMPNTEVKPRCGYYTAF